MMHLIHISPEVPPAVGGIADYTAILSRRLVEVSGGSVVPTLIRAGWKGDGPTPETEFNTVDCAGNATRRPWPVRYESMLIQQTVPLCSSNTPATAMPSAVRRGGWYAGCSKPAKKRAFR